MDTQERTRKYPLDSVRGRLQGKKGHTGAEAFAARLIRDHRNDVAAALSETRLTSAYEEDGVAYFDFNSYITTLLIISLL